MKSGRSGTVNIMGIKRIVSTDFWTDEKVVDMFSPEDKLFFLYLITNPHTTQLGIYPIAKRVMAFELGYSMEAVDVLLDRFENQYKLIKYSVRTYEIAVRNYLLHSIAKGGKPVEDLLVKEIQKVKDKSLLMYVYSALSKRDGLNLSVQTILPYMNDNDNDNDNEESSSRIVDESSSVKKSIPPTLEEVTAYCKERSKGVDPNKWYDFYQSKGWMIGKNKMKDWKAAVRTWEPKGIPETKDEDDLFWKAVERIQNE